MARRTIKCASCSQTWTLKMGDTLYEQQAVESCPCPRCGASTLCCMEPKERKPFELAVPVRDWHATPLRS